MTLDDAISHLEAAIEDRRVSIIKRTKEVSELATKLAATTNRFEQANSKKRKTSDDLRTSSAVAVRRARQNSLLQLTSIDCTAKNRNS